MHLAKRFYDMAAETSSDAQVPVMLALAKLGLQFSMQYAQDVSITRFMSQIGLHLWVINPFNPKINFSATRLN